MMSGYVLTIGDGIEGTNIIPKDKDIIRRLCGSDSFLFYFYYTFSLESIQETIHSFRDLMSSIIFVMSFSLYIFPREPPVKMRNSHSSMNASTGKFMYSSNRIDFNN
jgi:hypothetical protein